MLIFSSNARFQEVIWKSSQSAQMNKQNCVIFHEEAEEKEECFCFSHGVDGRGSESLLTYLDDAASLAQLGSRSGSSTPLLPILVASPECRWNQV